MKENLLISLFDFTGNASEPYRKNNEWQVIQVDIKLGIDIMKFDYKKISNNYKRVGIIAMIPCTAYANSGNRHKGTPEREKIFIESQKQVAKVKKVIDFFSKKNILIFWMIENPMTDIHKKNKWIGGITQKFNPCDFAVYDPIQDNSRYKKQTWLFGEFNKMAPAYLKPFADENPGWKNLGGKSEKTKELRSITPLGFAYAFYSANK